MEKLVQIHLNAPNMSRRGVRLRLLSYTAIRAAQDVAAKLVGAEATFAEFRNAYHAEALLRFIAEVTEPCDSLEGAAWKATSYADLSNPLGPLALETLFTAREIAVVERLFRNQHEVTQDELDLITGKATPVA